MQIVIQRGDNLTNLAKKHQTSIQTLTRLNQLRNADDIREGHKLEIPDAPVEGQPVAPEPAEAPARPGDTLKVSGSTMAQVRTVAVRRGDTLGAIARRFNTTPDTLMALNGISDPRDLRAGSLLSLPGAQSAVDARPQPRNPIRLTPGAPAPFAPMRGNPSHLSERDIEMLTRAVAAEARGESPEVWTAVAQVIINYAHANGRSIPRLVRSSYLSSNHDGNRVFYTKAKSSIPNYNAMREAVMRASRGESPIGTRRHFYDDSIGMPYYGRRGSGIQIGNMVFHHAKA